MNKSIRLEDGNIIEPDDELYPIAKMSASEIDKLADTLKTAALFFAHKALKETLLRKIAKLDSGITVLERQYKLGDYEVGVRKGIQGQDDDDKSEKIWPSVNKILSGD